MSDNSEDDSEYKDHYKRILMDMIDRRNKGFLESEEAVEGFASTSQRPVEGSHSSQAHSSSSTSDDVRSEVVTSFERTTKTADDKTTFPSRFSAFDDILDDSAAISDSLLAQNRRSPEGDQPLLISEQSPDPQVTPQATLVTPEPSLIQVTNSNTLQNTHSDQNVVCENKNKDKTGKNKALKFLRGIKHSLSPR